VFLLCQAFAAAAIKRQRPARIVNIAAMLSFQGGIRVGAYAASKHGVAGLTKAMANEWSARGINVNAVGPGYIVSNSTAALRNDPDRSTAILARIPAARRPTSAMLRYSSSLTHPARCLDLSCRWMVGGSGGEIIGGLEQSGRLC